MIENVSWIDILGCGAMVFFVYAGLRAYVSWWISSGRAARTSARISLGYAEPKRVHRGSVSGFPGLKIPIKEVTTGKPGGDKKSEEYRITVNNINNDSNERPVGNSLRYALRRLGRRRAQG